MARGIAVLLVLLASPGCVYTLQCRATYGTTIATVPEALQAPELWKERAAWVKTAPRLKRPCKQS